MTTVSTMDTAACELRRHLLRLLQHGRPTTTTELRHRLHESGLPAMVSETVYRNLVVLQHRGLVRRVAVHGRHAYWVITDLAQDTG